MPNIQYIFPIHANPAKVFEAISTAPGFDAWWSKGCKGKPVTGEIFSFDFGPAYQWEARVTHCESPLVFELQFIKADADWAGSILGFQLSATGRGTEISFYHNGWPQNNEHYRISGYCWAMYLRLLKRWLEYGEFVPYEERLNV